MYDWNAGMALAYTQSTSSLKVILPSADNMFEVKKNYEGNNDTLAIIAAYGVNVDLFDNRDWRYLTSTEYGTGHFVTHYHEMIAKTTICKCRLFAKPCKSPVVF